MSTIKCTPKRYFTEAARSAALAKRREKALIPKNVSAPEVFVVRLTPSSNAFTWEVRRFGGVVMNRGKTGFPSIRQARSSGVLALTAGVLQ